MPSAAVPQSSTITRETSPSGVSTTSTVCTELFDALASPARREQHSDLVAVGAQHDTHTSRITDQSHELIRKDVCTNSEERYAGLFDTVERCFAGLRGDLENKVQRGNRGGLKVCVGDVIGGSSTTLGIKQAVSK